MRHVYRIPCSLMLAVALSVGGAAARGEEPATPPGMVIYRDPATGRLGAPPSGAVPPAVGLAPRAGTVVETPGTTRAGGWKAAGRFRHTMRAAVGADGSVAVDCAPSPSGETH